jgi:dolichol-phosphate mannosyltransferase
MRCVVVVPTYNEAGSIRATLDRLLVATRDGHGVRDDLSVDVLVVDDSSPDGTGELVRAHPMAGRGVRLLSRTAKDGLGAAYRAGFEHALSEGYDAVVQMDADGSHPVDQVLPMLSLLDEHDVVVGSRYVAGGGSRNWPRRRRVLSSAANRYARGVLRLRTRDTTSGFRAWRATAIRVTGCLDTTSSGYGFQVENTWRAERARLRLVEHPITFVDRTVGSSKMSADVALEAARLVVTWRMGELYDALRGRLTGRRTPRPLLTARR